MAGDRNEPFVLGLDLDSVVADYVTAFREFVAQKKNVHPDMLPEPDTWGFHSWGFTDENDFLQTHSEAVSEGLFLTIPLMDGAVDALQRLSSDGVHVRIITHRILTKGMHRQAVADTVTWLDEHRLPYWDVCFIGDKSRVDADVYIDDAPHNVLSLRAGGGDVIVFDALYNRHLPGPRAAHWGEAEELVRGFMVAKASAERGVVSTSVV